jgi:hypothetical protein
MARRIFNPSEHTIFMKYVEKDGNRFYIGNERMDLNIKNTVIRFYPPEGDDRPIITIVQEQDDDERE